MLNKDVNNFNYELPDKSIAKYPLEEREESKLLVYSGNNISEDRFKSIYKYIPSDSLLIFNNTEVINARIRFYKDTNARIEIFCIEPVYPESYEDILSSNKTCTWNCLIGNKKKWKSGILEKRIKVINTDIILYAQIVGSNETSFSVKFSWNNDDISFSHILDTIGSIPIPPYLNRDSQEIDKSRYQTVYSSCKGSVAAPTAGLHFTKEILLDFNKLNIVEDFVTLHVGAGTFRPVKTNNIYEHDMHSEHFIVSRKNIENIINYFGNITIVGTTAIRTIESTYQIAKQVFINPNYDKNTFFVEQWEAYNNIDENQDSLRLIKHLLNWMVDKKFDVLVCSTKIMIVPGYKFQLANRLITNFHQPKSTLLMLLAAFIGDDWKKIYRYALDNNFRFLSYGDSSIIIPEN